MRICKYVYLDIVNTLKDGKIEAGGIIGSKDNIIIKFEFDRSYSIGEYIPDIVKLNTIIKEWYESGIEFAGIIHSHMDSKRLSYSDIEYARTIIKNNKLDFIYMMILTTNDNTVIAYKVSVQEVDNETIDCFD